MLVCTSMTFLVPVSTLRFALAFRPKYACMSMSIGASMMLIVPLSTLRFALAFWPAFERLLC
jgi:hypothetical protein